MLDQQNFANEHLIGTRKEKILQNLRLNFFCFVFCYIQMLIGFSYLMTANRKKNVFDRHVFGCMWRCSAAD